MKGGGGDGGSAATLAFRMAAGHGAPDTGGHTGASESVFVGLELSGSHTRVGTSGPFSHIASNMIQALGYFESSLSLKSAIGSGASIAGVAALKNRIAGFWSGKGK